MITEFFTTIFGHATIGFFIGLAISMTGIGAGAIIQPVLIHVLGITPIQSVGTGLLYAMITKIGGTISHFRLRTIRPRRSMFFLFGSVPAVLVSSWIINFLSKTVDSTRLNQNIQLSMAIILVAVGALILFQNIFLTDYIEKKKSLYPRGGPFPLRKKVICIVSGIIIGLMIGGTSIGGGVLIVPVFLLFLDASAVETVGSSIVIALFLSAVGSIVYLAEGNVRLMTAFLLCIGSIPGVIVGSRLSVALPERILRVILVAIVFLSGISLFFGRY